MTPGSGVPKAPQGWQFWVDRGGTFTDIVAQSPEGVFVTEKLLSLNPGHYADAASEGIRRLLARHAPDHPEPIAIIRLGTTLGTNALLERRGVPTALIVNRGLRDLLRIGDQSRPALFARRIPPRPALYQTVVEVTGRLDAMGLEIEDIDLELAQRQLEEIRDQGIESIAIALLHAWRNPAHEIALGEIAQCVGFREVVLSHAISSAAKIGVRAETAVVDAYVTPILGDYLKTFGAEVNARCGQTVSLACMQSNGGLIAAEQFRGRDSILSGPAGGLSGAIAVARQLGLEKIVTFDMGGTSTDVAHYAGHLERGHEQQIAGFHFTAPGLRIHTVAAGGGSILRFAEGRLQVGPESAGADPGPACYRRGGPLTVTDANLILGRLQPAFLPASFGATGDLPLDLECVQHQFEILAHEVTKHTGTLKSAHDLAEDFLEVAAERMALAIRSVSIERGFDLRDDYTLVAYGGAGGQHACQVAARLGIPRIVLHPLAGLLSALGIGLSETRRIVEKTVLTPLSPTAVAELLKEIEVLTRSAEDASDTDVPASRHYEITVALRYEGTDHTLDLPLHPPSTLQIRFETAYQQAFGLKRPGIPPLIERLMIESIEASPLREPPPVIATTRSPASLAPRHVKLHYGGKIALVEALQRDALPVERLVRGPLLILDPGSTLFLEPGWEAQKLANGTLVLHRFSEIEAPVDRCLEPLAADPLKLELFNCRFMAIAEEMGHVLQKTAQSVNIKERLDFSCALFDARGDLVANAPHIPVHLGSMSESVKALLEDPCIQFRAGDAWLINAPFRGGTHLPDITVISPLMDSQGQILFFVASRGHHGDVGGITPGSMPPQSRSIDEEGIQSEGLLILRAGVFEAQAVRQWLASGPYPARNPEQNILDLLAQIAANTRGLQSLEALCLAHGHHEVRDYMWHIQALAAQLVRRQLRSLHPGAMRLEMDTGAVIQVKIDIEPHGQGAVIDFSGTSAQQQDNFNAPRAVTQAAVLYVLRLLCDEPIPLNAGCLLPIRLLIPKGCFLNPDRTAAVAAGNVETSQHLVDALLGALGLMAASQGTMNNLTFGTGKLQYYETIAGGAGATPDGPGASGVQTHMTNSRMTDPEVLESRFPVRIEAFSIRTGSGGKGHFSGGDGLRRWIRFLEPMSVCLLSTRRTTQPFGLKGGRPGQCGTARWIRQGIQKALPACFALDVEAGDIIEIETPGGGGYGFESGITPRAAPPSDPADPENPRCPKRS